jgi:hypothetical protein
VSKHQLDSRYAVIIDMGFVRLGYDAAFRPNRIPMFRGNKLSPSSKNEISQYNKTKVMHVLFNLLRIKGLYILRALLAHPQEALHKRQLVYCVRVMSVSCTKIGDPLHTRIGIPLQSWCSRLT